MFMFSVTPHLRYDGLDQEECRSSAEVDSWLGKFFLPRFCLKKVIVHCIPQ